jgi:hypothetical protein
MKKANRATETRVTEKKPIRDDQNCQQTHPLSDSVGLCASVAKIGFAAARRALGFENLLSPR